MEKSKKLKFLIELSHTLALNKKQVVYIAGKVTGLKPEVYEAKFANTQTKLEALGYQVLNPCRFVTPGTSWQHAMRICLPLLGMADSIYMQSDWEDSDGAKIEHTCAVKLGLNTIYE